MDTLRHPAEQRRRPLRLLLLALLVAGAAATIAPSASAAGCAKGTLRLTVNGTASSFPTDWHTADVPLSQLRGTAPFTVYLTGSHVWTTDLDGNPAHVEFAWEYHVVLQRIV